MGLAVAVAAFAVAAQELPCEPPGELVPISGRIYSNWIAPGETLGVGTASLRHAGKLHCSLRGRGFMNDDGTFGGFVHTIVCDDRYELTGGDLIHSQIVAVSRLDADGTAFQSCGLPGVDPDFGVFREISDPQSGRGRFSPTGGGRLFVDGTISCAGAIDMKYNGEVCVVR